MGGVETGGAATGVVDVALPVPHAADPWVAAVFLAVAVVAVGLDGALLAVVPFALISAVISVIDARELRIPNKILGPAALAAVPLLSLAALITGHSASLGRSAMGAALALGIYGTMHLISPASLGFGDVKFAPYLGAHLAFFSWQTWFQGLVYGFLAISIVGVVVIARSRSGRHTCLPFGPFMAIGALLALL